MSKRKLGSSIFTGLIDVSVTELDVLFQLEWLDDTSIQMNYIMVRLRGSTLARIPITLVNQYEKRPPSVGGLFI